MDKERHLLDKVRDGVVRLKNAGVSLLDLEGNDLVGKIIDLVLDSSLQRFNTLIGSMGFDAWLMTNILADAKLVSTWHDNAVLYLEGLIWEAERISKQKGVSYMQLSKEERVKLVEFLYRPPVQRLLTYKEKMNIFYPDFYEQVPLGTKDVDWVLNISRKGLQKVLRCILEYQDSEFPPDEVVVKLWEQKRWVEYIQQNVIPPEVVDKLKGDQKTLNRSEKVTIANYNLPGDVGYVALDVMDYHGTGLNLKQLLDHMEVVLPCMKELASQGYFGKIRPKEVDRYLMLQKIFDSQPLF